MKKKVDQKYFSNLQFNFTINTLSLNWQKKVIIKKTYLIYFASSKKSESNQLNNMHACSSGSLMSAYFYIVLHQVLKLKQLKWLVLTAHKSTPRRKTPASLFSIKRTRSKN